MGRGASVGVGMTMAGAGLWWAAVTALPVTAHQHSENRHSVPGHTATAVQSALAALEARSGGRLGVALRDQDGTLLAGNRADERFAMCSTFKLPLAFIVLKGVEDGRWTLDTLLALKGPLPPNSPVSQTYLARGSMSVRAAAEAAVTQSDNGAANALLDLVGGPPAFTGAIRATGDNVTRLDRTEPALNENSEGDPRDTSSPAAMTGFVGKAVTGGLLKPEMRAILREWMVATQTGKARIRAGLPPSWQAGDKTGSCGTAYNDVAFIRARGREYQLAVFLDKPKGDGASANAILADVAKTLVPVMDAR